MNKNALYLAVFAVLCVLAGVLAGAGITRRTNLPGPRSDRPNFAEKAERFMGYEQRHPDRDRNDGGPIEMLTARLDLNAEQKVKVMEILEKTRQEIEETGKNIRSAINEIREKSDKQIMAILTPQQQEKFKALQEKFERGGGPDDLARERAPMRDFGSPPGEELPPQR